MLGCVHGRVYVSCNVVFDEDVFPFAALHPNAGGRLRADILLLPKDTPSGTFTIGDAQTNDYMHFLVISVVTNHG
jgi:hypothetical protein